MHTLFSRIKLLVLVTSILLVFCSVAHARHGKRNSEPEDIPFPRLMNYYELVALPRYKQVIYLNGVRQLVAELAAMEEQDGERQFVDSSPFTRYLELIDMLLGEPAYAAMTGKESPYKCVGRSCAQSPNNIAVPTGATSRGGAQVTSQDPNSCVGEKQYTCKSMPKDAAAKSALRKRVYGSKNAPKTCLIGGMWSSYQMGQAAAGQCKPVTTFKLASGKTVNCDKGQAMCNPLLFGTNQKDGKDAAFCTKPTSTMTADCGKMSDNGSGAINYVNQTKPKDTNGIDTAWNDQVANFQKLCGTKANDDVKTLNCDACQKIQAATYSLNFQVNKNCDLDKAADGADAQTKKTLQ